MREWSTWAFLQAAQRQPQRQRFVLPCSERFAEVRGSGYWAGSRSKLSLMGAPDDEASASKGSGLFEMYMRGSLEKMRAPSRLKRISLQVRSLILTRDSDMADGRQGVPAP